MRQVLAVGIIVKRGEQRAEMMRTVHGLDTTVRRGGHESTIYHGSETNERIALESVRQMLDTGTRD